MKKLLYAVVAIIVILALTVGLLEVTSSYTVSTNIHQDAPVKTVQQIEINASPEKVYQVMSNIDNWSNWQPAIQDPKLEGPFQKGASFNWKQVG